MNHPYTITIRRKEGQEKRKLETRKKKIIGGERKNHEKKNISKDKRKNLKLTSISHSL